VFVIVAFVERVRWWWGKPSPTNAGDLDCENQLGVFACCWLIMPVLLFSISQSKLPGYILPAIPAGALLLADYLRQHLHQCDAKPVPLGLAVLHALLAGGLIIPALLIGYIAQHRPSEGRPMLVALAAAFVLCAGIALTLVRKTGLRLLRFVTVIPVLLTVGIVMRLGAVSLDQTLSARPLAFEIASIETHPLPLAVYHVRRELEYGLTFYRNQLTFNYDWGSVPPEEHLLVAPENSQPEIAKRVAGRRVSYLGHYAPQHVDYYWVAAVAASSTPQ